MLSVDAYLKAIAAIVTLAIALVVLTARTRRGAVPLAVFLGLISLNQGAETMRALAPEGADDLLWFKVASIAASLDPFAFAWFAASLVPGVLRHRWEAWPVAGLGAVLALYAGWVLDAVVMVQTATHVFPLVLGTYTAVVYLVVLFRVASGLRSNAPVLGHAAFIGCLLIAALPAAPRPLEEAFVFVEPAMRARGFGGSFVPLIVGVAAVIGVLVVLFTRELPREARRAARTWAFLAIALVLLARVAHFAFVGALAFGETPPVLFSLGRVEVPLRWLIFGALGSVAVFGTELLDVPIETRRRAARLLVALGVLVIGGGALAVAAVSFGERPIDAIYFLALGGSIAVSQGFRRLIDRIAARLYGVPIPTDVESAHALYRRAVAEVIARGGAPARDPGLDRTRRSLSIDRVSAAAIEAVVEGTSRAPISPGMLIAGRYQIERLLGRGGGGRAFLASDLRIERRVVLKEIMPEDPEERDAALREARLIGALAHPNVLTVHDVLPRADGWIIVTEFVEGGTLGDALRGDKISSRRRRPLAISILDGAAAVHERGIVHGDIKPDNVVLTEDGAPKLADFGAARGGAGKTVHARKVLVGTIAYMAPELRGGARPSARSDVYALGLLVRALLPDEKEIVPVIERALSEDPAERFASAGELRQAIASAHRQ